MIGWLTWVAIGLQIAFWLVDAALHFLNNNTEGTTVSRVIWHWEAHHLARHILIGLTVATLFTHLTFGIP